MLISEEVKRVIRDVGANVTDETLISELGLDSLELVQFSLGLEDEFSIEIDVRKLDVIKTVADLIKLVEAYVRKRGHLESCVTGKCGCGFSEVFWNDPIMKVADEILKAKG